MFYFDMDGVLAVYSPEDYKPDHDGNMPYMERGRHYFKDRPADEKMLDVLWQMNDLADVKILTRVTNDGMMYLEAVNDKAEWLRKYAPFLNIEKQFLPITSLKQDAVRAMYGPLTYNDVLIDDYKHNLYPWFNAGGYGVKYLNGLNSFDESFPGINLTTDMSSNDIVKVLLTLIR